MKIARRIDFIRVFLAECILVVLLREEILLWEQGSSEIVCLSAKCGLKDKAMFFSAYVCCPECHTYNVRRMRRPFLIKLISSKKKYYCLTCKKPFYVEKNADV